MKMTNKKRLIDANELMAEFRRYMVERYDSERCVSEENCMVCDRVCLWRRVVKDAPTVDAVEVVHGYVLPAEQPKKVLLDMKCGICDQLMLSTDAYCPMCGAKMDGGKDSV